MGEGGFFLLKSIKSLVELLSINIKMIISVQFLIVTMLSSHCLSVKASATASPDQACHVCAEKATRIKQMSMVILLVSPLILLMCLSAAAATMWYFFKVILREIDEIEGLVNSVMRIYLMTLL